MSDYELHKRKRVETSRSKGAPKTAVRDRHDFHRGSDVERTIGNQAVQRLKHSAGIKTELAPLNNLAVSSPGDTQEREADRVAEQVLSVPQGNAKPAGTFGGGEKGVERSKQVNVAGYSAPLAIREALETPGSPLDASTRAFMESRFHHDFSDVRVHTGPTAEQSARELDASAYTFGRDVVFGAGNFDPASPSGRRLLAHELAHVVLQESPAFTGGSESGTVYRQVRSGSSAGTGGGSGPRRIVYLDNDVVGAVVDGNKPVAEALMKMLVDGADVRITRYNYVETTRGEPVRAAARKFVIQKLGIAIDEGGGLASRAQTYEELSTGKPAAIQPKDVPMMGAVKAAGPGAELWTLDGGPKENAKRFGVRLAPESSLTQQPVQAVQVGLNNVGLNAYEIAADGTPVRRGQLLPGKPAPTAVAPSAPTGGSSPSSPPSSPTGGAKPAEPVTTAEVGTPLKPIAEQTPGFNPEAGGGFGGAFQILQAKQVGNLQQDEIAKYEKRYAQLQPKINAWFAAGYSVELTCIVEKPKRPDFFCAAGTYCESDQIVFFHDLYISRVTSVTAVTTTYTTSQPMQGMSAPGGRDSFIPYVHQGGSLHEDWEIPTMKARDTEHHCVAGKLTVEPPLSAMFAIQKPRPQAPPPAPKPKYDDATNKALALAPSMVYFLAANIVQYKKANDIEKKLATNGFLIFKKTEMGGWSRSRTVVLCWSTYDKPRAEMLAEILRANGLPEAFVEVSGAGDDPPGHLQVNFGVDAEK